MTWKVGDPWEDRPASWREPMTVKMTEPQDALEGLVEDLENAYANDVCDNFSHVGTQTEPSDSDSASIDIFMVGGVKFRLTISKV